MRRLANIDLLGDVVMQQRMARASVILLAVGVLAGVIGMMVLPHETIGLLWFVSLAVVSALALPVHELVHAGAFKLLSGFSAHVRFGFLDWMLYTSAEGTLLPRKRFCVVLLAPTVIVTTALFVVPAMLGMQWLGWFLAIIHLAGCTGDLAYAHIIMREPRATHVEDTKWGIALFYDE